MMPESASTAGRCDENPSAEAPRAVKRPVSVSECGLELTSVRLHLLICTVGESWESSLPGAEIECEGSLGEESLTAGGFQAEVKWALAFPAGLPAPIVITGRHLLTFSTRKAIAPGDAEYYSQVNSVILAYPYLRQLVDSLSASALGRNVTVRPLDVPKFVRQRTQRWRHSLASGEAPTGADKDVQKDDREGNPDPG